MYVAIFRTKDPSGLYWLDSIITPSKIVEEFYDKAQSYNHRRMGRGGQGGARAPPVRPETLISRAIST